MTPVACVLVIDDDPDIRGALKLVLVDAGFRVETAVNGCDALNHLGCAPDLVLLDLGMPVMDGREFMRRFRKIATHQTTPVVVVSAAAGKEIDGVQGSLQKPFDNEALLRQMSGLLNT